MILAAGRIRTAEKQTFHWKISCKRSLISFFLLGNILKLRVLELSLEILLEKLTNNSLGGQNPDSKLPGNHINPHLVLQNFEIL
jgi:hypothetical protein